MKDEMVKLMKTKYKIIYLLLLATFLTYAQSGGNFNIKKSSIDSGGGLSTGGGFSLTGTIGQTDASKIVSGGNFSVTGGFWNEKPVIREDLMFTNGFED